MNKNTPLVSVVMSCYNAGQYIKQTIESILSQTYSNFEFVIWDDGSVDESREIIESFKDSRIRYFYNHNTGLGMALHLACEHARGKYIARIDSDDIAYSNRLEKEVSYLEKHPDYVLVSSAVDFIDDDGVTLGRSFPCTIDRVLRDSIKKSNMIIHPMVMMRRDKYEAAGGYIPIKYGEDRLFWSRLAKYGKFSNIMTPLGKYRLLHNSLSHSINPYDLILTAYRNKMIADDVISPFDIERYNQIYTYSKKCIAKPYSENIKRKKGVEEYIYKVLFPVFGQHLAEKIIIGAKNNYYRIKLIL